MKKLLSWTNISPILAWIFYANGLVDKGVVFEIIGGVLLFSSVLAAVHHSEVVAHKVGEPFGTIILAIAVTIIEVALIISLMLVGGEKAIYLARDTVFAAVMLIFNGILGLCLLLGGAKHREQYFDKSSVNTALVSLLAITLLTFVLPNYTTSVSGPIYSIPQMGFVAFACLVIYGTFLFIQTIRHRDYFLPADCCENTTSHSAPPSNKTTAISLVSLIACLGIVVLLAKAISPAMETLVASAGLPQSLVGVIIASIVLLPEGIAAIDAARRNRLQTSINLALGSALASIGLTIPSVVLICILFDIDVVLGVNTKSMVLMLLSFFTVMLSLSKGKTNILYGTVLLINLLAYIFTIIYP
ncbi:MAG: ionic transporter y4hA [Flavobacteriaceae bacterium]|nr:ionic transporter y4hA [Flavobacteriaceae bacterium]